MYKPKKMKKNNLLSIILTTLLLCIFSLTSQAQWWKGVKGNGDVETEKRSHKNFDEIAVSGGIDVHFVQNSKYSVKVEADENLLEYIVTEVKGDKLVIRKKKNINVKRSKAFDVYVSAPNLEYVSASSGSDFNTTGEIDGDDIKISVSSGADVDMNLNYDTIECSTSSGSDADIKGSARAAKLNSSSGSDIDARMLKVKTCKASASSGSGIKIAVSESLNASASSGGDVTYYGSPDVDKSESSGGDVRSAKR